MISIEKYVKHETYSLLVYVKEGGEKALNEVHKEPIMKVKEDNREQATVGEEKR